MERADELITRLDLKPHPEGGFYRETYRSEGVIPSGSLGSSFNGPRSYSTCIYFLLRHTDISAIHKINQDEVWHFYEGSPVRLHIITEDGLHSEYVVGMDLENGQAPQVVIPANHWFGAEVIGEGYALVGCTVAPGFDFADFELAQKAELLLRFPLLDKVINRLARD